MKFATAATIVSLSIGFSSAQPHGHSHQQFHKRVPAAHDGIAVVYELNGVPVPAHEVSEGIKNGTLVLANGGKVVESHAHHAHHAVADAAAEADNAESQVLNVNNGHKHKHKAHKAHKAPKAPKLPSTDASLSVDTSGGDFSNSGAGVDADFPDGQLDCSVFPSEFGAMKVDWLNLGGWTGVQQPSTTAGGLFDNIMTVVESMCLDGNCCTEGSFCSYACPAGYQKSQWPTTQGATGQSVGGIECKGGKLHLSNPGMSKKLCMKGTDKVKVLVKNTMDDVAAVCRTDYPGSESETIPLSATPGSTNPITCPDADNYYNWQGASTSAQYYVNPKGVPVSLGCKWGSPDKPYGNYAPLNLGVGYSAGAAWLSIFQNTPTTNVPLDYDIELVGDNGGFDNMIGRCKYTNGQFCTGDNYSDCSSTKGCTVNVASGTATYVFSARA